MSAVPEAGKHINRGMITATVMLTSILQTLDNTIATVALPHMQGSLSASQEQMGWVLTSYIVAAAIATPATGWLAGRFGRKSLFLVSIAAFTITSMLCGVAQSLSEIVLFRFLQGLSGAALVPLSQAVLFDINPPERHGRAMSVWGLGVVLGPLLGPIIGGWLTDNQSWRWVFYINLPLGVLAFAGVLAFMPKGGRRASKFDFTGFALLAIAVAALQLMLDRGPLLDWFGSTEICIEATVAALAFYLFVVQTFTSDEPFIHPALFKDRNYVAGNVFVFIIGVVMFATLALLPTLLQTLLGQTAYHAGWVMAPRSVGSVAAMLLVGRLVGRVDSRMLIASGFTLTAVSSWMMVTNLTLDMDSGPVVWSGVLQGFGLAFVWVPIATLAFATLPQALLDECTAFLSLVRNIGSSIGISAVQALLTINTQTMHASLVEHVSPYNLVARNPQLAEQLATHAGTVALNAEITRQAAMVAYIDDFKFMAIVTVCALPLLLFVKAKARRGSEAEPYLAIE
jgi:DHA2 family multidrug resistance protein